MKIPSKNYCSVQQYIVYYKKQTKCQLWIYILSFLQLHCNHSHFSESNLERAKFSQERVHDSGLRLTLRHAKVIAHKTSCQVEHELSTTVMFFFNVWVLIFTPSTHCNSCHFLPSLPHLFLFLSSRFPGHTSAPHTPFSITSHTLPHCTLDSSFIHTFLVINSFCPVNLPSFPLMLSVHISLCMQAED